MTLLGYGPPAPVPIFQHQAEFLQLLDLYDQTSPLSVLEVGSYYGGTLYHWLQHAPFGATVVSVDTYTAADNRHLYRGWVPLGVHLEVIQGDSHDPAVIEAARRLGPYDWVFIDADHTYEAVKQDWENYKDMATGIVCFHDILHDPVSHPEIDVQRLWREIQADYDTDEIISDPGAPWGGIGIVYL